MKKTLLVLSLVVGLMLGGCAKYTPPSTGAVLFTSGTARMISGSANFNN